MIKKRSIDSWKGLLYGIAYGLACRAVFALEDFRHEHPIVRGWGLMTISFMFVMPFLIGLVTAYYNRNILKGRHIALLIMPLAAVIGFVGLSVISGKEGLICALMALPVFLLMSMSGGFIGVRMFRREPGKLQFSLLLLLPFIAASFECLFGLSQKVFTERTSTVINADAATVWSHITHVKRINANENRTGLFQRMGFPRPIEAELDTVAVGGVRKAIFARGLFFTERVTEMQPLRTLAFDIHADPESTPPQALDEHVMVGGKYFDVLEGRYEIRQDEHGKLILHLSSQFRLSTPFNFYAGLWSKMIMRDIQENILGVIKARCEGNDKTNTQAHE